MNTKQNVTQTLHNIYRQFVNRHHLADEQNILKTFELEPGRRMMREDIDRSMLLFVLSGELDISTAAAVNLRVSDRQMFLVPAGNNLYGKAVTKVTLISCSFTRDMALFNRFFIERLEKYPKPSKIGSEKGLFLLPIRQQLFDELKVIWNEMHIEQVDFYRQQLKKELVNAYVSLGKQDLLLYYFQQLKKELLFIELFGLYDDRELARFFAPILSVNGDFKERVLLNYRDGDTVKELAGKLNISATAFKQKFNEAFGISAKQWMILKKKEKVFRDIVMTDIPISELADKYKYTINYMTTFCKKHFGHSPTELRTEYRACLSQDDGVS